MNAQIQLHGSEPAFSGLHSQRPKQLAQILLDNSEYVLKKWFPEGHIEGHEYVALNPIRPDHHLGSFKINLQTGLWSDFATGDSGKDLVELYGAIHSILVPAELYQTVEIFIECHKLSLKTQAFKPSVPPAKPATQKIPAPEMMLLPPDSDLNGNPVTHTWEYRTAVNDILFYVLRTEPEPGKKETKPCRWTERGWHWSYPEGPFPLYQTHRLQKGDRVLWGEGEKTADALDKLSSGLGMTSVGGSHRLFASDLSSLKQASEVVIFPDADDPGFYYATQLMWYALAHKIDCRILEVAALSWQEGEDAADHPELTWTDYEPHLIHDEAWFDQHPEIIDDTLFDVLSHLTPAEFDRCVDHLAKRSGLKKATLNSQRKARQKIAVNDSAPETREEVSDIDLPLDEKKARRMTLEPVVADLIQTPNLLQRVVAVCKQSLGIYKEDHLIQLGYLSIVSRLLDGVGDRPVSLMLKGSSGAGKSHVIKQVLKFFRPDATWIILSSISPKGLIYDQRSYRGKVLFLPECNQLMDTDSLLTQLVKTILTEGRITHLTVDTGESSAPEGKVIVKQGPIALILGTVRDQLDDELETRALSYYVDESSEQTRQIVLNMADRIAHSAHQDSEQLESVLALWLALDEWLALSPIRKVAIPFYRKVVEPIQSMPVRFRRDLVETIPALIKASALLHQAQRDIKDDVIQATIEDYEIVRPLVNTFLHRMQTDETTPNQNRLLKHIVEQMSPEVREGQGSFSISQTQLGQELGMAQQTIHYQLNQLIDKGYLKNLQRIPKKPAKLQLGPAFKPELLFEETDVLLSAAALGLINTLAPEGL